MSSPTRIQWAGVRRAGMAPSQNSKSSVKVCAWHERSSPMYPVSSCRVLVAHESWERHPSWLGIGSRAFFVGAVPRTATRSTIAVPPHYALGVSIMPESNQNDPKARRWPNLMVLRVFGRPNF